MMLFKILNFKVSSRARTGRKMAGLVLALSKDDDLEIDMRIPKLLTSRKKDTLNYSQSQNVSETYRYFSNLTYF
jgi:hypothetical protein